MKGTYITNDTRTVYFIMESLTTGGPGEQWIHPLARFQNGKKYWLALYAHYAGEGNYVRQKVIANKLGSNLFYKTKRSLTFSLFLKKLMQRFQILEEQREPISDRAKCSELIE